MLLPERHLHPHGCLPAGGMQEKGSGSAPGTAVLRKTELGSTQLAEKWSLLLKSPSASTVPSRAGRDEGDQTPSSFGDT